MRSGIENFMDDRNFQEAYKEILRIKTNLLYKNRFFVDEKFADELKQIIDEKKKTINKGSVFYRTRIYDESDKDRKRSGEYYGELFEGYDEKGSFVNEGTNWSNENRMNPNGIKCLYVSTDERTSIKELNPSINEIVSVAEIVSLDNLIVVDLSKSESTNNPYIAYLSVLIQEEISKGYSSKDYIFSQYVAAFCQSNGFDGIGYRSKYCLRSETKDEKGINYAIFNYKKCKAVSSKLYDVKRTSIQFERIKNVGKV